MDNMLYHINAQRLRPGSGASLDLSLIHISEPTRP